MIFRACLKIKGEIDGDDSIYTVYIQKDVANNGNVFL